MPAQPTIRFLLLALAGAACGNLDSRDFRPPPLATVRGRLTLASAAPGEVRVLLVWQPVDGRTDPLDVLLQANPLTSRPPLSCDQPPPACGEAVPPLACTARYGLAGAATSISSWQVQGQPLATAASGAFEVPIDALPPAAARLDLSTSGGRGSLAIGHLLFLPAAQGSGGAPTTLASSAFNGPSATFSSPYRTSSWLVYLDGEVGPACGAACVASGEAAGAPAPGNPGVLSRLGQGFSLILKLEQEDAGQGRLLPSYLSSASLDLSIAVNGHGAGEGGAWCESFTIEQYWDEAAAKPNAPWDRCTTTASALACLGTTPASDRPCHLVVTRYEADPSCHVLPGTGCTDFEDLLPVPGHAAFLRLPSGGVLALDASSARASFYDPARRAWWTTGAMSFPRASAAVTGLASGKVLVTGGGASDDASRSAELFDPATGIWTRTLSMVTPRRGHTATLLPTGEVLVIGGWPAQPPSLVHGAERFDPAQGTWTPFDLGTDLPPLTHHAAVLLPGDDPVILVTGSNGGPDTFLCRPSGGCRATTPMRRAHLDGTFTLLPSGKVLALGGREAPTSAELFDPSSETWAAVAAMPRGRASHAAVVLPTGLALSGQVLVAGGEAEVAGVVTPSRTVDLYDPARGAWADPPPADLAHARRGLTLVATPAGELLVLGGRDEAGVEPPVERRCLAPAAAAQPPAVAPAPARRSRR